MDTVPPASGAPAGDDPVPPFDLSRFRTKPLAGRSHLVETERFAKVLEPDDSARALIASLPDFLGAKNLRALAQAIVDARSQGAPVLWGMGGHVVKVGLGPLFVDLHRRGYVQGIVMNGAAAIHDAEVALVGSTSEDVGGGLFDGTYGSAEETGTLFAAAARAAVDDGIGFGTALARAVAAAGPKNPELSILCCAAETGLPVTVHVAVGTDTVHMHPECDGGHVGAATHRDFLRLATLVQGLDGGVYVNVGSAVLLPEVFMKAVAIAHNANAEPDAEPARIRITTGNLDMLRHYRPRVNVLERPAVSGYDIAGQHEMTVPLLRMAILAAAEGTS
ncbi:MAG: hypothetical protein QNJ98_00530 [Planctomycetota bacterium]|nr:hypothetical protein [Planctomycetota bacterium]